MPLQPNPHALNHLEKLGVRQPVPRIQIPTDFSPATPVAGQNSHTNRVPPVAPAMAPRPHRPARPIAPVAPDPRPVMDYWPILRAVVHGLFMGVFIAVALQAAIFLLRLFGILSLLLACSIFFSSLSIPGQACFAEEELVPDHEPVPRLRGAGPTGEDQVTAEEGSLSIDPRAQPNNVKTEVAVDDSTPKAADANGLIDRPGNDSETITIEAEEQESVSELPMRDDLFELTIKEQLANLLSEVEQHLADFEPIVDESRDAYVTVIDNEYLWLAFGVLIGFAIGFTVRSERDEVKSSSRHLLARPSSRRRASRASERHSVASITVPNKTAVHRNSPDFTTVSGQLAQSKSPAKAHLYNKPKQGIRPRGTAVHSIRGPVRADNQDFVQHLQPLPGVELIAVADGCGGVPHGARAAKCAVQAAVESISATLNSRGSLSEALIAQGFEAACLALEKEAQELGFDPQSPNDRFGLNTTLMLLLANETSFYYGYIGDGCVNLLRSSDELIELMQPQRVNNLANVLAACLGPRPKGEAVIASVPRQPGDLVLMATDGIADQYDPLVLARHLKTRILAADGDVESTVERFLNEINEQTDEADLPLFDDNLSLALIFDGEPGPRDIKVRPKSPRLDFTVS